MICEMMCKGSSERAALLRAGIGTTAFALAKRSDADLRARLASARDEWARIRPLRHAAALYENQTARSASRKALRPQPTYQAKLVMWHLIKRVPLNFAAPHENVIAGACERFDLSMDAWRPQEQAFGLLKKVYEKRAKIRGEQLIITKPACASEQAHDADDGYGPCLNKQPISRYCK